MKESRKETKVWQWELRVIKRRFLTKGHRSYSGKVARQFRAQIHKTMTVMKLFSLAHPYLAFLHLNNDLRLQILCETTEEFPSCIAEDRIIFKAMMICLCNKLYWWSKIPNIGMLLSKLFHITTNSNKFSKKMKELVSRSLW